jgi:hypothetical protein
MITAALKGDTGQFLERLFMPSRAIPCKRENQCGAERVLTGKQKIAVMLRKAGYTHEVIAEKMGLKNRESVTRLLARANGRLDTFRTAVTEHLGDEGIASRG